MRKLKPQPPFKLFYTDELIADILVQKRGLSPASALVKARSMSKQRRRQVFLQFKGMCIVCGKPRGWIEERCDVCAEKDRARRRITT